MYPGIITFISVSKLLNINLNPNQEPLQSSPPEPSPKSPSPAEAEGAAAAKEDVTDEGPTKADSRAFDAHRYTSD